MYVCMYLFKRYIKTDRKNFCKLLSWSECSTLLPFFPFIRQPLSKFTLRRWAIFSFNKISGML